MTDNQRKQIKKLRADDCGYMKISYMYIHAPLTAKRSLRHMKIVAENTAAMSTASMIDLEENDG